MKRTNMGIVSTAVIALLGLGGSAHGQASFEGLGGLPGSFQSHGLGVSGDGDTLVGSIARNGTFEAIRWTEGGGMQCLITAPPSSRALAASFDGSTIVGWFDYDDTFLQPYRWTEADGWEDLGMLPGGSDSGKAHDVSADGVVIVGEAGTSSGTAEAFVWTQATGMQGLGFLPGMEQSVAEGVSADASVVTGYSVGADWIEAFRWTQATGMQGLGDLPGGSHSSLAYGISADGFTIVGRAQTDTATEAVRWTNGLGPESLGTLGGMFSVAEQVNGDGSRIVGGSEGSSGYEAFLWTEDRGMRRIAEILEADHGLDLTGWVLREALGISDDGTVITGIGFNPAGEIEAWRAVVPRASDWNGDGTVNSTDHFEFLNAFLNQGDADFNGDGITNSEDYFEFLRCFRTVC